jgi:hypothetical protein
MYTETGKVSKTVIADLQKLLDSKEWRWEKHITGGTNHHAVGCMEESKSVKGLAKLWPIDNWEQIVFMRLPPGNGKLYRHSDEGFGYTIPIETNEDCVSLSYENDAETKHHLEVGKLYFTDRSIEHESFNTGKTNRTHLLVMLKEYPDNE